MYLSHVNMNNITLQPTRSADIFGFDMHSALVVRFNHREP